MRNACEQQMQQQTEPSAMTAVPVWHIPTSKHHQTCLRKYEAQNSKILKTFEMHAQQVFGTNGTQIMPEI